MHREMWSCFWGELLHIPGHRVSLMFHEQVSGSSRGWWKEARVASADQEGSQERRALLSNTVPQPVGKRKSQEQDCPHFQALITLHTHRTSAHAKSLLLCLRIVQRVIVFLLLSGCILLTVSATSFFRLWPHCQCLRREMLLWVLRGAGAHVLRHHGLCFSTFAKMPALKFPEQWEEVTSPRLWDTLYHLSSKAIHLGLYAKVSHENTGFSLSIHILSRLHQGLCTWFLHHPHLPLLGHQSLLLSSSSPTSAFMQWLM